MKWLDLTKRFIWNFFKNYWHGIFLLYYFIVLLLYSFYNKIILPEHYMYFPPIDDIIPFNKYMIVPYVYWYFYIVMFIVIFVFVDKDSYYRLIFMMFMGMTVSFIVFTFFPNGQQLRPSIGDGDIFLRIIRGIYATDNPTNSAPSMHTIDAIAVHLAVVKSQLFKNRKLLHRISFGSMVAIVFSTVMIKQHSIIDVLMGCIVALGLYYYIYKSKSGNRLIQKCLNLKFPLPGVYRFMESRMPSSKSQS